MILRKNFLMRCKAPSVTLLFLFGVATMTTVPLAAQIPWLPGSTSAITFSPFLLPSETDPNPTGLGQTLNQNGLTVAALNPFFQALGTNGRTCATCHQPSNSMSMSVSTVQQRYNLSHGQDPLFAAVDGANCPDAVTSSKFYAINDPNNPHSLLLNRALIRIGLPWPPKGITPEFSIVGVSDPTHCELNTNYGLLSKTPTVSVYRRSLMAANLKYVTTVGKGAASPGQVLAIDPYTGLPESGNIMYDGREPTLQHQAMDAILTHAQASSLPCAAIIQQIVDFENNIYTAQASDNQAQSLTVLGASGGPGTLANGQAGIAAAPNTFSLYASWANLPPSAPQEQQRASVARGEAIFNGRPFIISNVAGINDLAGTNLLPGTCATCHANTNAGNDVHPQAQLDEGTSESQFGLPASDLPMFYLVCDAGKSTPFNGSQVWTRDPGLALITGKCADIGKVKSAQLRGLASRAPYFHDGSAAGLSDVVNFYNKRFSLNLSRQEMQDLINFLNTL
jgi:cytochrome c553